MVEMLIKCTVHVEIGGNPDMDLEKRNKCIQRGSKEFPSLSLIKWA